MPQKYYYTTVSDTRHTPILEDSQQIKRCSACQGPFNTTDSISTNVVAALAPLIAESSEAANLCNGCRERCFTPRRDGYTPVQPIQTDGECDIDVPRRFLRRSESIAQQPDEVRHMEVEPIDSDEEMSQGDVVGNSRHRATPAPAGTLSVSIPRSASRLQSPPRSLRDVAVSPPSPASALSRFAPRSPVHPRAYSPTIFTSDFRLPVSAGGDDDYPDPLADITRLRVRSKGHKSLYPGATFKGTQKSGRNSYDVHVTLVDVDFASSSLCGYLSISGLTDDWPELTTYFDAQIIGDHHGFITQDWGASAAEDQVHWKRFPAFRAVENELQGHRMTLPNNESRSAVFMRWKERFLVPDHRVQDINGASFAGFYYVCVDFNPPPRTPSPPPRSVPQDIPLCVENGLYAVPFPEQPQQTTRMCRNPGTGNRVSRRPDLHEEATATMTGFYFHQNSEPYQQLSLTHVKDRFQSSFEFR